MENSSISGVQASLSKNVSTSQPLSSQMTSSSIEEAVSVPSDAKEDEPNQVLLTAIKRRRRSSVFIAPAEAGIAPAGSEASTAATEDLAAAIPPGASEESMPAVEKRRKSLTTGRRNSIGRRSLCSAPPPVLSISDQVQGVTTKNTATMSQLLDICIRDSMTRLCRDKPHDSCLSALKSMLVLNSEQISEEVSDQLATEGIVVASLVEKLQPGLPLQESKPNTSNTRLQDETNTKECKKTATDNSSSGKSNLIINLKQIARVNENNKSESGKENVGGSRKRKFEADDGKSSGVDKVQQSVEDLNVKHKRRLIEVYEGKTEILRAEYKTWKQLKVQRKEHHSAAKREYAEARNGQERIGEEQAALLNVSQKSFLSAAPDYGRHLQLVGRVAEQSIYSVARCEQAVERLRAAREVINAAADRAYYLADAAVYNGDESSLRCHLDELTT